MPLFWRSELSALVIRDAPDADVNSSPRRFSWLGPDPGHHFSIAVSI